MDASPYTRFWQRFRRHRISYYCLWIFLVLFVLSLGAEWIANDKPLVLRYRGEWYFPVIFTYLETEFGGDFATAADYQDTFLQQHIRDGGGWWIMPPIPFSATSIHYRLAQPAPSPPSFDNWLGTDDQGRDLLARMIYGYRLSVVFAAVLTLASALIGVIVGACQGYYGGKIDLIGQRLIEIWSAMPTLFMLIILASLIEPGFWWLLGMLLLFSWMSLVDLVRAEFLRGRNLEYVIAARAIGVSDLRIIWRHILPNAMVSVLTFIPFLFTSAITTLTALDFLGYGLPVGTPSLGEMVAQAKNNLHAPWIGISVFVVITLILSLLLFIGTGLRDAFDPHR